jgi:UDP-N-acetylmuramoyl-tripeptide--D-alanyl-D-alanine ligase
MLQASEYNADDFLRWNLRVSDFARVEKRKRLLYTPKAIVISILAWIYVAIIATLVVVGLLPQSGDIPHGVALWLIIFFPLMLPYLLAFSVRVMHLIQLPVEAYIVRKAANKLTRHSGFKIAIAGSFGKTSMREILRVVLSEMKKVAAPGGSENTPLAIARFIQSLKGDEEVLIFELGEYYPGDVRKLCRIVQPDLGIITGVNEAHLQKFKTLEAAADTIFELAEFLSPEDLYVNAENQAAHLQSPRSALEFSRDGVDGWRVSDPKTGLDGTSFVLEKEGQRINVHSKLLGLHHVGPLAVAATIASRLGLSIEQIQRGLSQTKPFAHRLERKNDGGVITLDDSYNGNPDGVKAVIEFLVSIKNHRRWYVTPGLVEMGNRAEAVHREIGRQLAQAEIEKVVLIKNSVTPWIEAGLNAAGYQGDIMWFDDALVCYASLPRMTIAGDVVLLQNDWPDQYA